MHFCVKILYLVKIHTIIDHMKRREFVYKVALGAAASALPTGKTLFADTKEKAGLPDMVAIHGGTAADMFEKGIAEMGGMSRFVKKGQTVVIKPNIGWDRPPEYGANTDPGLVAKIVKHCFDAGAKEVFCFDHTCGNDWDNRYKVSGIAAAVESNGGKMVPGNTENMYEPQIVPKGVSLKDCKVHKLAINPDVFINIPVLKHHGGAKITCALKNYMGCIWDRQWWHRNNMPQCIADYASYQKTTLTIVDAYRVMLEHGPRGKSPEFSPIAKYQLISTDIVAADVAATQIFASVAKATGMGVPYKLDDIKYIEAAEKLGVGTTDLSKLNVKRISMA